MIIILYTLVCSLDPDPCAELFPPVHDIPPAATTVYTYKAC